MAQSVREMNEQMVERIAAQSAVEPPEGSYALRVLEHRGRTTGRPRRTPIAVVRCGGHDHLVSPDLSRDWVRNLRADPSASLVSSDRTTPVRAVPVDADDGVPVVRAYLGAMTVPWALRAFPVEPDASPELVRAHMDTVAVFRLDPR